MGAIFIRPVIIHPAKGRPKIAPTSDTWRDDQFIARLRLYRPEAWQRIADCPTGRDIRDRHFSENTRIATYRQSGSYLDMLRQDDLDNCEIPGFWSVHIFRNPSDEKGITDQAGAAEDIVAFLKLALTDQTRFITVGFRFFLSIFLFLGKSGELGFLGLKLRLHHINFGRSRCHGIGSRAHLLELFLKIQPVLLHAKLVNLAAQTRQFIGRGVFHTFIHPLERKNHRRK